ncbi:MAG: hypothetical protein LBU57_01375 [Dysgonamonadaceae bacterium]|jgi:hypothetical protein|nr:hypothetical protein [Dysgonamonadaceae bacterium]
MTICEAAKKLANDETIINSYTNFDKKIQYWVFSKNGNLLPKGQTLKPGTFPLRKEQFGNWWKGLTDRQKRVLYSTLNKDNYSQAISNKDYEKIKKVYDSWPLGYIAVYYGVEGWSCNQFVGEALFMAGKTVMSNGKYYSAKEIWEAKSPLVEIDKEKTKIKPGDIAAFGGTHVEIVTNVDGNDFCSIGAGRGSEILFGIIKSGNGVEVCGFEFYNSRYINSKNIKFRRLE